MKMCAGVLYITLIMISSSFAETIRVAAAGNLQYVLPELVRQYPNKADQIDITFASSGKLYAQISKGAPYDIFMSADITFPTNLAMSGQTASNMTIYATGKIILWSLSLDIQNGFTKNMIQQINYMVIANPKYAPYGKAAMEWLQHIGVYDRLKKKLVNGDNLAQTAHYVKAGAVELGIIALSQYTASTLKGSGTIFIPDEKDYSPIEQGMVRISSTDAVQKFYTYLQSKPAKTIFTKFGYGVPN